MQELDQNNDGKICFKEFCEMYDEESLAELELTELEN